MASKDPKMSKQGTADKKKEVTLMIHHKLEIIMRNEGGKRRREVMASNSSGLSTIYDTKKWKDKL
jgi:hypothetical protein